MTNIRDLKYITEIAKEKNFSKAAKLCYVSQPAMSMQVKKLEETLNTQIFERDKNSVFTTKSGEKIVQKAQNILKLYNDMIEIAKLSQDKFSGDFKIGAFPTLASYYFPKITKKIAKKFPNLKIFLVEEKTEKLMAMLENGELDCAFFAMPVDENDFDCVKIFEEPFYLAVPHDHKLAKRAIIAAKNLENHELMLLEEGHCMRDQSLEVCELSGAFENTNFRASSLETLRQMVKIGAGITLIPEIAMQKDDEISYIRIKHAPKRNIGLYWRKSYYRKELIEGIQKLI